MKKIALVVLLAALVLGAIWFLRRGEKPESPGNLQAGVPAPEFVESGNLVQSGEDWKLIYEEPGKPALTAELSFGPQSTCKYPDGAVFPCPASGVSAPWVQGARAEVSGSLSDGKLSVLGLSLRGN